MSSKRIIVAACLSLGLVGAVLDSAASAAPGSELVGLRRLTQQEYRNSIADIFGPGIAVQGSFEPGKRVDGLLSASSAVLSITPAGFESFRKMADGIAAQVVSEKNRAASVTCTPKSATAADDTCATQFLSHYGLLLFRRPLTADELRMRVDLAGKLAKSSGNFYTGLRYSLATLLTAPDFLFRTEIAIPAAGKEYTLDGYSRAARLSYLLWDTTPDAELLHVAETGELNTQAGVAKQVDRLMASPRLETGVRAFFNDMLELDTFDNTTKDGVIYPNWSSQVAASAREETLRTIIDLTLKNKEDMRDLLTTRKTFINRVVATIYDVPFDFSSEWAPYEFSKEFGRSGLLTEATFLSMFSHAGRSSPTKRGVAFNDIFMCEPTPPPPADVSFDIVNDVNNPKLKTVRQRLLAHATHPACASCHTHNDPIGLSLENFDSIGQYRTIENGDVIDASSALQGKKFVGAVGLGMALHDNPKFPACVARKMYAYGTGAPAPLDVPAKMFRASLTAFASDGYRLPTLLKTLATSPEFFSAPPPAPPAPAKTAMNDTGR